MGSVKLLFWKQYKESFLAKDSVAKDLVAKKSKPSPVYTSVYDPATGEAKLVTWKEYLKTHKAPPVGNYTTVYDAKTQSCKLVTWRDYLEHYKSAKEVAVSKGRKIEAAKSSKIPEYTAIYDEKTKSVKLQLWDEYLMENKPTWRQEYAVIYEPETKSMKLIYWKDYVELYEPYDLKARDARKKKESQKVPKTKAAPPRVWN